MEIPPNLSKLQDVDEGLHKPDTEGAGGRSALGGPDAAAAATSASSTAGAGRIGGAAVTAVSCVALAGIGCLPLWRGRPGPGIHIPRGRAAAHQQFAFAVSGRRGGGRSHRGAVLGAEVVDEPAEAENLHREGTEQHEEKCQPKPPALASKVVVDGQPEVRAHVCKVHSHGGQNPESVP